MNPKITFLPIPAAVDVDTVLLDGTKIGRIRQSETYKDRYHIRITEIAHCSVCDEGLAYNLRTARKVAKQIVTDILTANKRDAAQGLASPPLEHHDRQITSPDGHTATIKTIRRPNDTLVATLSCTSRRAGVRILWPAGYDEVAADMAAAVRVVAQVERQRARDRKKL